VFRTRLNLERIMNKDENKDTHVQVYCAKRFKSNWFINDNIVLW